MLQNIRDRSQGWLAWVIVIIIVLTFALWGIHNYFTGSSSSNVIAKVNGHKITETTFNTEFQRAKREQQAKLGGELPSTPALDKALKQKVLEQMITDQVLSAAAFKEGYRISMQQIDALIQSMPLFQENGQFSQARFQQALNALMYTPQSFINNIQDVMLMGQARSSYAETAFVLPFEVNETIRLINQKRDFGYLIIPVSHFTNDINVPDSAIKVYYNLHKQAFKSPEQVSLQYVELSAKGMMDKVHVNDDQIQQYYNDNINMYTTPQQKQIGHILVKVAPGATPEQEAAAKQKIAAINQKLQSGQTFSDLAKTQSDDKVSAKKGGDLGWVNPGTLGPQFANAIKQLKTVGQVIGPVRTKYGYNLIKLEAVKPAVVKPLAEVKPKITNIIKRQKIESMFADQSDQLANITYENPGSLEEAAKTLNLPIQTTALFGHQGAKEGIAANPKIISAAFSDNVLTQGNNSDPIQPDPQTLIVVRVLQHKPAAVLPLDQVKDKIRKILAIRAATKKAEDLGEVIIKQIDAGQDPKNIAKENNLTWEVASNAGRHAKDINATILTTAFALPQPSKQRTISVGGIDLPAGGYSVIKVNAVHTGKLDPSAKISRKTYRQQLEQAIGEMDYSIYKKDKLKRSKIKIEDKSLLGGADADS